jgi:DNA-binding winged helix-turn-helix (wHTH) protein/tetratricopeptide (TPR) repeat protein
MILKFGDFEIDPEKGELRKAGAPVHVGPRTLSLLHLLASNHERLVSKDEIIENVWGGRVVSDSAVSTAIKEARKAVGDDGTRQEIIRTVHGVGFRCVAEVRLVGASLPLPGGVELRAAHSDSLISDAFGGRPSIAVLPFRHLNAERADDPISDAIPAELISALSRLRWLAVTARGSSFRFRGTDDAPQTVRDLLKVRYCLTGLLEDFDTSISANVELADTETGNVIWGDQFTFQRENVHEIRAQIASSVIAALEVRIPLNEANLARMRTPGSLDAWAEYHLGLQHMYRFNRRDNAISEGHFQSAVAQSPGFARAHAALSFTAFQDAFLQYSGDPTKSIERARESAEKSLELDFLDPFANYSMGRVSWLMADLEGASGWLERSVEISPNFAQAHYLRALMDALAGQSDTVRPTNAMAMSLSPLDPLHYAMLGTHAMSYINEGNFEEALGWAEKGARAPGSHHLLAVLAAVANQLAGKSERAAYWVADVRKRRSDMNSQSYFQSFPFADTEARSRMADALQLLGF